MDTTHLIDADKLAAAKPTKERERVQVQVLGQVNGELVEAANFIDDYQITPLQFTSRTGHYPIIEDELSATIKPKGKRSEER